MWLGKRFDDDERINWGGEKERRKKGRDGGNCIVLAALGFSIDNGL